MRGCWLCPGRDQHTIHGSTSFACRHLVYGPSNLDDLDGDDEAASLDDDNRYGLARLHRDPSGAARSRRVADLRSVRLRNVPAIPSRAPPLPGLSGVESALTLLVRGTTAAEQEYGLMVGFDWVESSDADRITVGAAIDEAGVLDLEFALDGEPWHPGTLAGTSSQAFSFVDPLYATVFQFPEVTGIGPGSLCWGKLDCTQIFTREMWESMVGENTQRDVGPGCGMQRAWFDPACGASLPLCGDGIKIVPGTEGATGSAVYYLEIKSPSPCFMKLDGTVTVLSADGTAAQVDGSPLSVDMAGVVTDGFTALDGSTLLWVMQSWCEEDGTVRIEMHGTRYDKPAGGRCDAPEASATLGTP